MKTTIFILIFSHILFADVTSSKGSITFDVNADNSGEAVLTTTGLGIGTVSPSANLEVQGNGIITTSLNIGSTSVGASNLNINGSIGMSSETFSSDGNIGSHAIVFIDTSSDNVALTLPTASSITGTIYSLKKISTSNSGFISSYDLIDGNLRMILDSSNTLPYAKLLSDGSTYHVLAASEENISYQKNPTAWENLENYWKLDETSVAGGMVDSGNDLENGTYDNMEDVDLATGKFGNAADLTDSSEEISVSSHTGLVSDFTISLWIYWSGTNGSNQWIFSKLDSWDVNDMVLLFGIPSTNKMTVHRQNGVAVDWTSPSTNQWVHVVLTYDASAGQLELFYDGTSQGTKAWTSGNDPSASVTIGNNGSGGNTPYDGKIDDIRVYNKILSQSEIDSVGEGL